MTDVEQYFNHFKTNISSIELPQRFTFPFYYEPHSLAEIAAKELQEHLKTQKDWKYDFGMSDRQGERGKMFGVLVVQNQQGKLGYLSAFSGKLADSNHLPRFVPPVFDMLTQGSFFNEGMQELAVISQEIKKLENEPRYLLEKEKLKSLKIYAEHEINAANNHKKLAKKARKEARVLLKQQVPASEYQRLEQGWIKESQTIKANYKRLVKDWKEKIEARQMEIDLFEMDINALKIQRKNKSAELQQRLFKQYQFLNQNGETKHLIDIFQNKVPKSGAGECAAPKLLQYAFANELKPVCMAEFWWGESPKSEIRKHKHYYPACKSKCQPILGHMLQGIEMDENPLLKNLSAAKTIDIVYEDEAILIINKPAELLSIPGIQVKDSVQTRLQKRFPAFQEIQVVHRLDMSTSGLMLVAKTEKVYKFLQYQFIHRHIKKRYVAVLDGIIEENEGKIELPLRVDLEDRPRQLVDFKYGKLATTHWKVIKKENGKTFIHFYPITGRTHQLRVHAAHPMGLNTPIIGDDLYGKPASRLHLHAEWIAFLHPLTQKRMNFRINAPF